jgi:hypothetical protein
LIGFSSERGNRRHCSNREETTGHEHEGCEVWGQSESQAVQILSRRRQQKLNRDADERRGQIPSNDHGVSDRSENQNQLAEPGDLISE